MPIENLITENKPEQGKSSSEQKKNFTDDEQKLIDVHTNTKNIIKNEMIDPSNMEAKTKKVGGEAGRSDFFENNYKTIAKNPDKYPTLYPLLQTFLINNKIAVDQMFEENFNEINKTLTREETDFCNIVYNSYEMQSWLQQNQKKNKRIVRNKYNDLLVANIFERIDQKEWDKFTRLTNIVNRVVKELYYAAADDIQKNTITPDTKQQLITTNALLSHIKEKNPALYDAYKDIHTKTKEYLATIKGETIVSEMNSNLDFLGDYDKTLEDFVTVATNKNQDPLILQEAVITIQPVIKTLYENGLENYTKAKEETDPLQQIMLYKDAQENFKKINAAKKDSGVNFTEVSLTFANEEIETFCNLSAEMTKEIDGFLKSSNIVPLLYEAGYKKYQEALIETDEDSKKEKYESAKGYFETIVEHKTDKNMTNNMRKIIDGAEIKLKNINSYLTPIEGTNITIENVDIASLPVLWGPSPFPKNSMDPFHLYVGNNKQQFDTIEIFNALGQLVTSYEINKDVFLTPDTQSTLYQKYQNPVQLELPLGEQNFAAGAYIFRISSKTTNISKSEKFVII